MSNLKREIQILEGVQYTATLTTLADKLYLSQPYISRLIKKMEDNYQIKLVNRTNPLSLTKAGESILNNMKEIQAAEDNLHTNIRRLKHKEEGVITVAICSLIDLSVTSIIATLHRTFPETLFKVTTTANEHSLTSGEVDIVIGQKWNNPLFQILPFEPTEMSLLIPDTCPLYNPHQKIISFSEEGLSKLNSSNYIAVSNASFLQQQVNYLLKKNHISINKLAEMPTSRLATQLALKAKATTITTTKIAQDSLTKESAYCLMPLPRNLINLTLAVSYLQNSPVLTRQVAQRIYDLVK